MLASLSTARSRQAELDLGLGVSLHLPPDAFEKARKVVPGYDIHALYHEWQAFAADQAELPRNATAAFLGFCKRRYAEMPLR